VVISYINLSTLSLFGDFKWRPHFEVNISFLLLRSILSFLELSTSQKEKSCVYVCLFKKVKMCNQESNDYFGKGLQVFFLITNFYMQMDFWMKLFVTCFKKSLNFLNASHFFCYTLLNKYEFSKISQVPYIFNVSFWKMI
jgi:hypothetical protein